MVILSFLSSLNAESILPIELSIIERWYGKCVLDRIDMTHALRSFGLWYETIISCVVSSFSINMGLTTMIERIGDIWTFHHEGRWIAITTNIGWKKDGKCPMGAGIAATAADLFPDLPGWYGTRCQKYRADTAVCQYKPGRLIMFPTKALDIIKPWASWQQKSDLILIKRSAIQLQKLGEIMRANGTVLGEIALPLAGCENGGLMRGEVVPILNRYLDDGFVLYERN